MPFREVQSGNGTPHNEGRTWVGEVTLSSGTATINYADDLPGVRGDLETAPLISVTGPTGGETVNSAGTTQATVGGDTTDTVNVVIYEGL